MKMNKKKGLRVLLTLAVLVLSLSCFSITAFASADDVEQTLPEITASEAETTPETAAEPETVSESEETSVTTAEVLTPEGNLTLVDDIETDDTQDKQFITVQSKSGSYFYIIIDRSGDEDHVYFLNLVDEADLLALIGDDESTEDYYAEMYPDTTEQEESTQETEEPEAETSDAVESENSGGLGTVLIVVLVVAAAGGGYWYFKFGRNRKPRDEVMDFFDDEGYEEEPYINEDEGRKPEIESDDEETGGDAD